MKLVLRAKDLHKGAISIVQYSAVQWVHFNRTRPGSEGSDDAMRGLSVNLICSLSHSSDAVQSRLALLGWL